MGNTNFQHQRRRGPRAGMTSVLAMLYLVLFSSLAIGFYAATNTATQVTTNDENVAHAFVASESGMDFMRYQLANVHIPATTPPDQVIDKLYVELQNHLNTTGNMGSYTVGRSGNTITIPGDPNGRIKLDSKGTSGFRITITDWLGEIVCKSQGYYGSTDSGGARAITMDYTRQQHNTSVFSYAVASKGQVVSLKGALTATPGVDPKIATVMSAEPAAGAIVVSGGLIGGNLNVVSGGTVSVSGGTVGGSSIPSIIMAAPPTGHTSVVDDPEFPTFDPTVYKQYATNNYVSGAKTQANVIVKAATNPKFNANDTVNGIMYIESPNQVTFNGNFNLNGFIVMATSAAITDSLSFKGNLTMAPVPNQPQYDKLRATSGVAVLAPNAAMNMTGSSGGSVKGNIIVKSFSYAGASNLVIDQGTLMTLNPATNSAVFNGAKSVTFAATGENNQPKLGVSYSTYFAPKPGTYQEVAP